MKNPLALISRPVFAASIAGLALTGGSLLSAASPAFADDGTATRGGAASDDASMRKLCPPGTHAQWSLSYTPPSTITLSVACVANASPA